MTTTTILAVLIVGVAGVAGVVASVVEDDPAPAAGVDDLDDASSAFSWSGASARTWVTVSEFGDIDGDLSCDDALRLVVENYVMHMDDDIREYSRRQR